MDSMLGYGFEKSDRCAEVERKLEWSVSRDGLMERVRKASDYAFAVVR